VRDIPTHLATATATAAATVPSPTVTPGYLDAPPAHEGPEPPAGPPDPRPRVGGPARLWRGPATDPPWVRPALLGLLGATGALYLWSLGESGWANAYYSAAAQAGAQSWTAFFFGSFDAGNAITVDKAPLFLWPMALSARVFGVNAWSVLVPQALEGVAAVGVLYLAVRRWAGPAAGLLAGAVLAVTPVATLMFRFNNPDALLVLLLTLAAYATVRAIDDGSTWWAVAAGAFVGLGFLAKMLQALLVVPGLGAAYVVAAPGRPARRARDLALATLAVVAAGGWWVAIVELWPASARPYVGGSQTNSVVELMFGYNGFGRLTGNESGSVGGGPAGTPGRWGATGLDRLFNHAFGGQASWLLPAALVFLAALLVAAWRAPRDDRTRAAALLWGGWLLVTGLAISLGQGIIHEYYTVALAPAIGALVGIGAVTLWRLRRLVLARVTLAAAIGVTAWWAGTLLARTPDWAPAMRPAVLVGGALAAAFVLLPPAGVVVAAVAGAVAVAVALAGPAAYSLATAGSPHGGAIPTAGPTGARHIGRVRVTNGFGPGGVGGPGTGPRAAGPGTGPRAAGPGTGARAGQVPVPPAGGPPGGLAGGSVSGPAGGPSGGLGSGALGSGGPGSGGLGSGALGSGGPGSGALGSGALGSGALGSGGLGSGATGGRGPGPNGLQFPGLPTGPVGGILEASHPSAEMIALLGDDAGSYRWVAATVSANQAAGYQLATGDPVLAIGGFNGTDPSPTLGQFRRDVTAGRIHWFVARGAGPGFGGQGATEGQRITAWVRAHFAPTTVDGVTLYDLTAAPSASASRAGAAPAT
jgi:4-amino-4-deoxy-L-arabinose transferase-like glycosyltransferase